MTFASPSKNSARKKEKKKGMAMDLHLFALDANTREYYILCHFIRNKYLTRM